MDIFEDLNIEEVLKEDHNWLYNEKFNKSMFHNLYERIYYDIDDDHFMEVNFTKGGKSTLIISMVKSHHLHMGGTDYDTIFSKTINKYSKYFFLFRKLKSIKNSFLKERIKKEEDDRRKRVEISVCQEKEKKRKEYEKTMSKVPKSFLRDSTINKILED